MGSRIKTATAAENIIRDKILPYIGDTTLGAGGLTIQTSIVVHQLLQPINLYRFHRLIKSHYGFELFCALKITKYGNVCVNLFSSGKLVLTGVKSEELAKVIIDDIYCIYNNKYCNMNTE